MKRLRGKLALGLGAMGFEHEIIVERSLACAELLQRMAGCVAARRGISFASFEQEHARHDGAESGQGGAGERLVEAGGE